MTNKQIEESILQLKNEIRKLKYELNYLPKKLNDIQNKLEIIPGLITQAENEIKYKTELMKCGEKNKIMLEISRLQKKLKS